MLEKSSVEAIYPLGPAQRGMLYYCVVHPDEGAYVEQLHASLAGDLRPEALRRAWELMAARHGALRSQFAWEHRDRPLQVVRRAIELPWTELDWREVPEGEVEERLADLLRRDRAEGVPLDRPPLLRVTLVRRPGERWEMVWTFHHILLDGWSMGVVLSELWTAYAAFARGREPELPDAPSLGQWSAWLGRRDEAEDRAFWRRALAGLDEPFAVDFPGGGNAPEDGARGYVRRLVSGPELERLAAFARSRDLTLNALAQGAWALLLRRSTGRSPVAFGAVASGRPPEVPGIERLVGVFMNAVPAWVPLPGSARAGEWLRELQAAQAEARDHAHRPLEEIQEWLGLPRREPPFDTLLVFENYPADPGAARDLAGAELLAVQTRERGTFPVALYMAPRGRDLHVWLDHRRDRLGDEAAERLMDAFLGLMTALAEDPDRRLRDLPLLDVTERRRVLGEWASGGPLPAAAGERPVHELFAGAAELAPDAVAVVDGARHVTFRALAERSGRLAARLRRAGVGTDEVIGLVADRSAEMVAGMLGILQAGGAYLPIDPTVPSERAAYMLEDAGVRTVAARASLAGLAKGDGRRVVLLDGPGAEAGAEPAPAGPAALPESLAYVIYTSGSTGRPKGVLVEHRNLASYTATAAAEQAVGPGVRVLQFASLGFDTSAEEIWPCLTRGGTLVLRDDRALGGPAALAAALHEWRPEVLDLPTAFWHELAPALAAGELALPASVRLVIIGGEKALGERLADWRRGLGARAGQVRLLNTYGPTETTIVAAAAPLADEAVPGDPPIGGPVAGARIVVLDPGLDPVPPGVAGEVLIGGAGVSRGYLGRPSLTAERFVPDPFADGAFVPRGARLYRTGDAAAWREDGRLEFRGRLDGQLKIRGYRVEPGEVESALAAHPAVLEAAVLPWRPEGAPEIRLAAYAVPRPGAPAPDAGALRAHLEERLPAYMVPSAFALVPGLPRTASGKLDREALPEPEAAAAAGRRAALRTPMEELLAGWWCELLGLDRVGRDDDFFRLGGHSLLVGRLAARVRRELGVDLPLIDVFEHSTLGALAARVAGLEGGAGGAELPPLVPADRSRPLPLSYQQERVWFLQNLVPGTVAYNFQLRMRLLGRLDVACLERALTEVVRRHEVLRTTFPEVDGEPRQVVHAPWRVRLPLIDLQGVARTAGESGMDDAAALDALAQAVSVPFDVTALPLIRWQLLRLDDEHHQLVQVEHHFVHDGWSVAILLGELDALYSAFTAGEGSPLPELAVQYGDFAAWQRGWMEGEAMERLLGYWRRKLDGAPTRLDLPADRPRPPRSTLRGDAVRELLPAELYRELRAFGRREGFTLFMTMMAAFQALLGRYTAATDFLVGMGIANRRVAELEPLIGMMVNSLVARADLGGDPTFRELLERVRRTTLEAYAHQDMPFERLVGELQPERDASRNPLFQAMFSFHDAAVPDLRFGGLEAGFLVEHNRSAKTDLNVIVAPRAEQRVGRASSAVDERAVVTWEFSTDLFDRSRIERLIRHYYTLTAAALANPDLRLSELPLLDPAEEARVLDEWSGRGSAYPREAGLPELFARQAAARPDEPAVTFGGESLSYRQLDRLSAAMARRLAEAGVGRGTPVALALERSADLVPAVLGIVRAGGCYVPLDPSYPEERLAFMLEDSGARVVVADARAAENLPALAGATLIRLDDPEERARLAAPGAGAPDAPVGPDDAAYVIYTSGSTGRPKAVVVPHRAVARLVLEADFARFEPGDVYLQLAPVSFDAATLEVWAPLLTGGRLVVHPPEAPTLEGLSGLLAAEGVTTLWLTAGLFHQMVDEDPRAYSSVRQLLAGGDVLSPEHCRRVLAACPGLTLVNGYGPTENTTFTACHRMAAPAEVPEPVPIGRPVADTRAYVVDSGLRPAPAGVPGELVTGGDGLAWGYWRRPALTAERFVPDPFAERRGERGARVYRTGDRVRWLPSGELEFLGRYDTQVKVRGFRVEPGEVEAALARLPGVAEALVLPVEPAGERILAAFVVPREGEVETLSPAALRAVLAESLPAHMVPQAFVLLERFPLTPNGKVDRKALAEGLDAGRAGEQEMRYLAPRTLLEEAVAGIWSAFLPVERVGVRDDFFELGGHSLIATRIVSRIRKDLGVALPLGALFELPTVEALCRELAAAGAALPGSSETPEEDGRATAADPWGLGEDLAGRADSLSDQELDALLGQMLAERGS